MADPVAGQSAFTVPVETTGSPVVEAPSTSPAADTTSTGPSWFDELPAGLQSNPTLQNFKGKKVADVAKSLVNAEELVGGSLRLPTDKDTPAEKQAKLDKVFSQLGRPEKAGDYKITTPTEDVGVKWDPAKAEAFKAVAHQLGLTQSQVDGLIAYDIQQAQAAGVDSTQAYNACLDTLNKDWGPAAKTMLGLSRRTAATYFPPDVMTAIESTGLSNNPAFVKALASMGKELMEEGLIIGAREGMSEDGGSTALQTEYNKIMSDDKHPYWNNTDPGHADAVTRMHQLQAAILELAPTAR
jgi:hypothetical protein